MESQIAMKRRVERLLEILHQTYPGATCELDHENPYQLLAATILSAQCTDKRVNMVTPALFRRCPDPTALAAIDQAELENIIRSTGFYRNKAKNLIAMATALVERHGSVVPPDMEALRVLPGVGRKTANVVLGTAFGRNDGVVVDTHVGRITQLLGLTRHTDAEKIERDLIAVVPQAEWTNLSHLLIHHGRNICIARRPQCDACPLYDLCPGHRPLVDGAPLKVTRPVKKTAAKKAVARRAAATKAATKTAAKRTTAMKKATAKTATAKTATAKKVAKKNSPPRGRAR